jgi:parvulin-like peptidyl-prolyl isomerase
MMPSYRLRHTVTPAVTAFRHSWCRRIRFGSVRSPFIRLPSIRSTSPVRLMIHAFRSGAVRLLAAAAAVSLAAAAPVFAQSPAGTPAAPAAAAAMPPANGTAAATSTPAAGSSAGPATNPVLVNNAVAEIRRSDYDAELLRLPPAQRNGFGTDPKRVIELLSRMLTTRTLAQQAKDLGIDQDPDVQARIHVEVERFLAQLRVARVETEAAKEFDAHRADFESRARELYVTDKSAYEEPAQVSASHILFTLDKHSKDEGEKLAREWRARILAGEDFNEVAKKVSEDPSAASNAGRLGFFTRKAMDPAFADAAFALAKDGDISEPVLSRFGWHLIRRDGYKAAKPRPYEEVRDKILDEIKQKYVIEKRDAFVRSVVDLPGTLHEKELPALIVAAPDSATARGFVRENAATPAGPAKPAPSATPAPSARPAPAPSATSAPASSTPSAAPAAPAAGNRPQ